MTNTYTPLGPGSVVFGSAGSPEEFALEASAVAVEPSTEEGEVIPLISGRKEDDGDQHSAALTGTTMQDLTLSGFVKWCIDNRGKRVPVTFIPNSDLAVGFTGEVKVRPIKAGGDVDKKNTSDFEFPFVDFPEFDTVTPPATDPYGTADDGSDDEGPVG